jgi:SAM-dependent methyltransferase
MSANPLTSETAQRLIRLGNSFCEAQALLTAVELGIFTQLAQEPASSSELADQLGLPGRGLTELLQLLCSLNLVEMRNDRFLNSAAANSHLVHGRPGDITGFLRGSKENLYPLWNQLTQTLRSGKPPSSAQDFAAMMADEEKRQAYVSMMNGALQPLIPALVAAIPWQRYGCVLDVGGCGGHLISRLQAEYPQICGHVFDLPAMANFFTARNIIFHPGDFFQDPLPPADVIIVGHVLPNWSPVERDLLLRNVYAALRPGGLIVIYDRMLADNKPHRDSLIAGLVMILVTEDGSEYLANDAITHCRAAGFTEITCAPLGSNETIVCGRKLTNVRPPRE